MLTVLFFVIGVVGAGAASPKPTAEMSISGIPGKLVVNVDETDWSKISNMPDPRSAFASAGTNSLTDRSTNPLTSRGGPASGRSGTVSISDLEVVKVLDASSAELAKSVTSGQVFPEVEIEVTNAGQGGLDYLRITMENVTVTGYSPSGASGSGPGPLEEVTFHYEKLTWEYGQSQQATATPPMWATPRP
jgi:type VI secretion system Hcp family effector